MNTYFATQEQENLYLSKFPSSNHQCDCGQTVCYIIEDLNDKIIICDGCHENNDRRQAYDFCKMIQSQIKQMDEVNLLELNNRYCELAGYPDSYIYSNDEEFFDMLGWSGLRVAQATFYGEYNYSHAWVTFDGYGNFKTYESITPNELVDYGYTMTLFINENFEQFEDLFQ